MEFTEISPEIYDDEHEIELMFQKLVHAARKQEVAAWILIALIGFISIVAFYLLWLKAS